jgi:hypothetical protein
LRFIRVPVGDLLAASALERLLNALRKAGFPFSHAATGHGRYASAGCSISDIDLFVMLAEIGDDTIEGNIYELVIWAAKPTRKTTVFSRTAEVLPSENNILLWERVISSISAELVATLNAGEVVWEDVGSPSPAT